MSKKNEKGAETSRRDFLRIAGIGTVTGGAALAVGKPAAAAETRADGSLGYRETEHVKTYYKLAKF
ncbi:MAG: ubiquinol-cytochrome c reductase iron-sulfur subunit N-terminal domain-containing protein [Propylenella sp.]